MNNLLDIYTKLKVKSGNEITITYQTNDGKKHTEEVILLDIIDFTYILVSKNHNNNPFYSQNNITRIIPFFSKDTIIESITFKNSQNPTYLNPFINKNNNLFENYYEIEHYIKSILDTNYLALQTRKKFITEYLSADTQVEYDQLFFSEKQKKEFEFFFNILVRELSEYAKRFGLDSTLKKISTGTTSIVYEIGDKIIKIGKPRRSKTIPYCEFVLQPIINRDFEFDDYPIHIEVTQKVLALDNLDGFASLSEDERFQDAVSTLSKNLYLIGLATNDLSPANVGILLDDNKIHFDEINFDTASEQVTSIENNNHHRILPKGRYVIIDLDSLVIENSERYVNYLKSLEPTQAKTRALKQQNN